MSSLFGSGEISTSDEYLHEITGFIRVHKDGRCERFLGNEKLPAGIDSSTGVQSNDVVISSETNLFARIYIPKTATSNRKLPVLIYFHGGGFVVESPTSPNYHPTLNHLTAESNVIAVSVDYRLPPEYPLPVGYDDCWEALPMGQDMVFFAGDSTGANIAHNLAIRFGSDRIAGINLEGIILIHPYFGGSDPIGSELGKNKQLKAFTDQFWKVANPSGSGLDDPLFNPEKDPNLSGLGCSKILLAVAEKDCLRDRGLHYKELMEKSGWAGKVEMLESKDEDHVFFWFDHVSENACTFLDTISTFINHNS
ncbi:putative carboxylesterase [Helianthus debilis subsp. tardiflorus]